MKPSWGPNGTLVYAAPPDSRPVSRDSGAPGEKDGILVVQKGGIVSEARDVRFANFSREVCCSSSP
jgi:nuclear pore complex protein Nup98-Nup96